MRWRALEDAFRVMRGHPTQCSVAEYMAAIEEFKKGDQRRNILLLAARRAEAYDALADYDREPNDLNLRIAADAMASAAMSRDGEESARETLVRLLPSFPPRGAPAALLTLLVSSAASERRLGETLGDAMNRIVAGDEALRWAHESAVRP